MLRSATGRQVCCTRDRRSSAPASRRPSSPREMLQRAADWADSLEREGLVKLSTNRDKGGIVSLLPRLASDNGLVTIYNDINSA